MEQLFRRATLPDAYKLVDRDVSIVLWVTSYRKQSKLQFIIGRQGEHLLQCTAFRMDDFSGVTLGSCIRVSGRIRMLPVGKTAPGDVELYVASVELLGGVEQDVGHVRDDSGIDVKRALSHLTVRTPDRIRILNQVSDIRFAALAVMRDLQVKQVEVPGLTPTACEGGAELFSTDFFGQPAYLTQSSQLYLEILVPALGPVFCLAKSWRAEPSRTRRHLAEFEHFEMEGMFETLGELTSFIENMVIRIATEIGMPDKYQAPFRRMTHTEAVAFCNEKGITKDDGSDYQVGEDLPESAERAILAILDEPMFLTRFPRPIKAFYMLPCHDDPNYTESCDLLLPGVGEVVGGSLRIHDHQDLVKAAQEFGTDLSAFPWYQDLRKVGTHPHGGFGLGMERLYLALLDLHHIEEVVPFPISRAMPPI